MAIAGAGPGRRAGTARLSDNLVEPPERLILRRLAIGGGALGFAVALLALGWHVLAAGGWTLWEVLILACLAANAPLLGLAAATGVAGFGIRLLATDPVAAVLPALRRDGPYHERGDGKASASGSPILARTVIAMCVRLEDMQAVLPPLDRLLRELRDAPDEDAPDHFALAILSDTPDRPAAMAEAVAVARLAAQHPPGAVRYRRRACNAGFKAGNLMDFLDHHAAGFDFALLLDADSTMSAAAVRRLVRVMQVDPGLAILQPTVAGRDEGSVFARNFGFGHRHGTRVWATGQAWWQGPQGAYWGHNALLRIAPFREHGRLPALPGGGAILSHDIVEAARLHAVGWAVRVLPDDAGSTEAHPPDLPAMLDRDQRWAAGNLQYLHLLRSAAFGVIGRLQMLQAILHYALTPLWFGLLPLAAVNAATGGAEGTPRSALLALLALGFGLMQLPKLAGYAEALLRPSGEGGGLGRARLLGRMARETLFILLLDPIAALDRTVTALRLPFGQVMGWARKRTLEWSPQRRAAGGGSWRFALRRFGPHTLVGLALLLAFAEAGWFAVATALPAMMGLLLAVPFSVLTARAAPAPVPVLAPARLPPPPLSAPNDAWPRGAANDPGAANLREQTPGVIADA